MALSHHIIAAAALISLAAPAAVADNLSAPASDCIIASIPEFQQTITVAQDGSGDYTTVTDALKKVRGDMEYWTRIIVKKGVYKEKILMNATMNKILIQGEDPDSTIITYGDYASLNSMGTSRSYTVRVDGNNVYFYGITFENSAGPTAGQAVAVHTTGDCIAFQNCRFLGNQDTLYTGGRFKRCYFRDCYIEGTTDYIFGASTVEFINCTLHCKADSFITAASTPEEAEAGFVFDGCKITAAPGVTKVYLGRPWRPYASTYFIRCEMPEAILPAGWHNWSNTANEATARYGQYECTGPGASTADRVKWAKVLTAEQAAALTDQNRIFSICNIWKP